MDKFNKDFKKDWQQASQEDRRHIVIKKHSILNAIYMKPKEFYYQITGVDIMNPIKTFSMKKNETKEKVDAKKPKPIVQIAEKVL